MSEINAGQDPIALATELFQAYEARDWNGVAALTAPDSLAHVKQTILEGGTQWHAMPPAADMHPPDAHPAVIEYFQGMADRFAKHGNPVLREMSVSSLEELKALSPHDTLVRFLQGKYIPPERYWNGRGPVRERRAIGSVPESDTITHVVYRLRTDVGTRTDEEYLVLTTRRTSAGWRAILNDELSYRTGGSLEAIVDE